MAAISEGVGLLFRLSAVNNTKPAFTEAKKDAKETGDSVASSSKKTAEEIEQASEKSTKKVKSDVEKLREAVEKESKEIKDAGGDAFNSLAKDLGLSAEQTAQLGAALPVVGTAIAGIAAAALGAVAAIGGLAVGFFKLTESASEYGSQIFDVTEKTGLSATAISALKLAADQGGSSLEAMSGGLEKFGRLVGSAAEGSKEAKESLERLGVDPKAAINDLEGSFSIVIKRIYEAKTGAEQIKLATEAFGRSGADLIGVIKQLGGDFESFKKAAEEAGLTLSDTDAKAADDFGDALTLLQNQLRNVSSQVLLEFAPDITKGIESISNALKDNKDGIKTWAVETRLAIGGLISYWEQLKTSAQGYLDKLGGQGTQDPTQQLPIGTEFGVKIGQALKAQLMNRGAQNQGVSGSVEGRFSGDDLDGDEQRKAAEKAAKELADGIAKLNAATQKGLEQSFENLQAAIKKNYEDRKISAEDFHAQILESERVFRQSYIKLIDDEYEAKRAKEPTAPGREAVDKERIAAIEKIISESDKRVADAEKIITQTQKKQSEERIKITENELKSKLELQKAEIARRLTQNNADFTNGFQSEKTRILTEGKIKTEAIEDEIRLNKKLLTDTTLTAEKRAEVEQRIGVLTANLATQKIEASTAVQKQIDKETEAADRAAQKAAENLAVLQAKNLQAQNDLEDFRKNQERKVLSNDVESARGKARLEALRVLKDFDIQEAVRRERQTQAEIDAEENAALVRIRGKENEEEEKYQIEQAYQARREQSEAEFQDRLRQIREQFKKPTEEASESGLESGFNFGLESGRIAELEVNAGKVTGIFQTMGSVIGNVVGGIAQGIGSIVQSFVLLGNSGGQSLRKFTAQVLASVAAQAAVLAVFELAKGFAALFFDPAEAVAHFTAAAIFGSIAGVAALAGRAIAGDSFKQKQTASNAFAAQTGSGNSGNQSEQQKGNSQPKPYSSFGDKEKVITNGVNDAQNRGGELVITFKGGADKIADWFDLDFHSNGKTRRILQENYG